MNAAASLHVPNPSRYATASQGDGSVIFVIFVAPDSEFARFQPTYQAILKSMQF